MSCSDCTFDLSASDLEFTCLKNELWQLCGITSDTLFGDLILWSMVNGNRSVGTWYCAWYDTHCWKLGTMTHAQVSYRSQHKCVRTTMTYSTTMTHSTQDTKPVCD